MPRWAAPDPWVCRVERAGGIDDTQPWPRAARQGAGDRYALTRSGGVAQERSAVM